MTAQPASARSRSGPQRALERAHEENLRLLTQARSLRAALEAAVRENGELRREVAHLRAEDAHLRGVSSAHRSVARGADADRLARIRVMLRDSHSCNP